MRPSSAILIAGLLLSGAALAQGFKFSASSADAQAEAAAQARKDSIIDAQLSTPCREHIKNRKIMVLVGEETNGSVSAPSGRFGPHVDAINTRLQALGLHTYSAEQIRRQIAQEEVDAVFRNDPDRALSASRRLGAHYVLKGVIATEASRNKMVNVNQVRVAMNFTLTDASGRPVSTAGASHASYAGSDVPGMALTLVQERADEVVAKLYSDYCRRAK